jgi:putative nucleotidyltransferase with HDIG domain
MAVKSSSENEVVSLIGNMRTVFLDFFHLPFNPANLDTNKANITSALLNIGLILQILYFIPGILTRGLFSPQIFLLSIFMLIFLAFRLGIRKGYVHLVSKILLIFAWVLVEFSFIFYENGIRAPAYTAALAFLIAYAGILHGRRGAITLTLYSLFTSLSLVMLEHNGISLTKPKLPDIYWAFFGQVIFFSATAFLIIRNLSNLEESIQMYKQEAKVRLHAETEIRDLNKELTLAYDTTLEGWAKALELKDKETEGHSRRVTELTWKLAKNLGFAKSDLIWLRHGALLHDIGKMGIPDEILQKQGKLSLEERKIIEQHPMIAYNLLKDIRFLRKSIEIPLYHHERWDGKGYPKGLKGEEIPLCARIFAVVDVWDALQHDRPYRKAWPREKAERYLLENSGSQFDPKVVEVFLRKVTNPH